MPDRFGRRWRCRLLPDRLRRSRRRRLVPDRFGRRGRCRLAPGGLRRSRRRRLVPDRFGRRRWSRLVPGGLRRGRRRRLVPNGFRGGLRLLCRRIRCGRGSRLLGLPCRRDLLLVRAGFHQEGGRALRAARTDARRRDACRVHAEHGTAVGTPDIHGSVETLSSSSVARVRPTYAEASERRSTA